MRLRIFQFVDPQFKGPDDDTRWIAASTEEAAIAEAKARGWKPLNWDTHDPDDWSYTEIMEKDARRGWARKDYKAAGCDVVLS